MAYNHRMQGISEPYLTRRLRAIYRTAHDMRNEARGPRDAAQQIRNTMAIHGRDSSQGDYPGLAGRSNMQNDEFDDSDFESETIDADLMPDTKIPINPAVRAFQESGHGVQVFRPRDED